MSSDHFARRARLEDQLRELLRQLPEFEGSTQLERDGVASQLMEEACRQGLQLAELRRRRGQLSPNVRRGR